jgi:hypothetical protein
LFLTRYGDAYQGEPLKLIDPHTYTTTPAIHIFDVSGLDTLDQQIFLAVLLDQLYRAATQRKNLTTFIVVEEAHNFAPRRGARRQQKLRRENSQRRQKIRTRALPHNTETSQVGSRRSLSSNDADFQTDDKPKRPEVCNISGRTSRRPKTS